ncbi:MAG: DUF4336 domain-containing protein [Cereibacter changlensis]
MAGYPSFNQLKPVAEDIWIVDAPPIHLGGVTLPVRMTVIRLGNGAIWLHSPTEPDPLLLREIEALGPVRHLVAPSIGHWTFVETWQRLHPQAQVWAVPGLRERAQVRRSKLRIDHDLSVLAPVDWREDIEQCPILTPLVFREVAFLHRKTSTLLLTDLISSIEPEGLATRIYASAAGVGFPVATTPRYLRPPLRLAGAGARRAMEQLLAWRAERVIFAHGRWFEQEGAAMLRRALGWLIK